MSTVVINNKTQPLFILRFIAAVAVVFYHYEPDAIRASFLHPVVSNSSEFVNFFYFISGFVLVIAYKKYTENNNFPAKSFWVKRVARIYPVYLAALLIALVYHFFFQATFTSLGKRLPFELLMIQTWFYSGSINYPSWSVSCEMFFYLCFPFIIQSLFVLYKKGRGYYLFFLLMANIVFFSWLYLFLRQQQNSSSQFLADVLQNHPVTRIVVFVLGTFCAYLFVNNRWQKYVSERQSTLLALLAFVGVFYALHAIPPHSVLLSYGILAPLYFLFILAACNLTQPVHRFLSNRVFIFLGDISYAIYILQFPVYLFFAHFVNDTKSMQYFLLYLLTLIAASAFSYKFIETPLRDFITRVFTKPRKLQLS